MGDRPVVSRIASLGVCTRLHKVILPYLILSVKRVNQPETLSGGDQSGPPAAVVAATWLLALTWWGVETPH